MGKKHIGTALYLTSVIGGGGFAAVNGVKALTDGADKSAYEELLAEHYTSNPDKLDQLARDMRRAGNRLHGDLEHSAEGLGVAGIAEYIRRRRKKAARQNDTPAVG